ncbi:MAG: gfo/Idh/MocA family oxidoreductase, partial [Dysgonamonadaceae bacterium]|nr:gfo/Idh/MocA family oxidoreductase [Dysgonamonadaceae bacterium]
DPVKVEEPEEIIDYERKMPLTEELKYFIENLNSKIEIADGKSGYEVVKVLEKVQQLIDQQD